MFLNLKFDAKAETYSYRFQFERMKPLYDSRKIQFFILNIAKAFFSIRKDLVFKKEILRV